MNNVADKINPPVSDWELAMNPRSVAPAPKKRVAADKPAPRAPKQPPMDTFVSEFAGSLLNY